MVFRKQNYFQRRTKPRGPRANERIRATQVQVISNDGTNLGTGVYQQVFISSGSQYTRNFYICNP